VSRPQGSLGQQDVEPTPHALGADRLGELCDEARPASDEVIGASVV
jgi:hypothetical protein